MHPRRLMGPWNRLALRWKLVVLNAGVVCVAGLTVLMLVHHIDSPSVYALMHKAAAAATPQMAQQAYDSAVDRQVIPTVLIAAVLAIALNLAVVTVALRPLGALRGATRRLAAGEPSVRVGSGARDDIGEVAKSFDDMAAQLQRLEELRQQAADDVAHELRTPLHNILGLVEGMRDGVMSADRATLERVHREVLRLTSIVDDLRTLAEARAARFHLHRERVLLTALAREVTRGFEPQAQVRGLNLLVNGPADGDVEAEADPRRVFQVLHNLVENAVRYARSCTEIDLGIRRVAGAVRVEVSDQGEEIPADVVPFIFERFVRADRSRGRTSGGAGIGLAIVRELVAAHGGQTGAESRDSVVTVWFELPSDDAAPAQQHASAHSSMAPVIE
ncbi:MAG: HAMP domain-containing histidine kinase [Chloroflexi bacterium]|nr:MAG: HAMP domain-containing histidine kinase [Chloroflexota bacterium]